MFWRKFPISASIFRNYPAELFALKHRINAPEFQNAELERVLTNPSFYDKGAILEVEEAEGNEGRPADNSKFVDSGESGAGKLFSVVFSRSHLNF